MIRAFTYNPDLPALLCLFSLLGTLGCSSSAIKNHEYATSHGFETEIVEGRDFRHIVFINPRDTTHHWNVYIDGDGIPWINRSTISPDPTQTLPVGLRLSTKDRQSTIYLGRPCYHGLVDDKQCHPWFWTHGRFSEPVISSMKAALERLIETHSIKTLDLIGHSGGGTIALLIAQDIPQVSSIYSLAGNVDIDQWSDRHSYSKLESSMNPSVYPRNEAIKEIHVIGKDDQTVSPKTVAQFSQRKNNSCFIELENCGHTDCWEPNWPLILSPSFQRDKCE